jgi:uncharacterized protein (TIGR03083 family)
MTTLADRTIAGLRASHDVLAALVPDLTDEQLRGPSGATEWSVAQVLSHLGSGAEIGLGGLAAARDGVPMPGQDANQRVWDRWNAMSPREQATGFVEHNARLVAAYEALTADQRAAVRFDYGFLPAPLSVAAAAGMRLNESTLHSWDARVGLDQDATVPEDAAQLLIEHLADDLAFMTGFTGKADALAKPATVQVGDGPVGLVIGDGVRVTTAVTDPTATFVGPLEAVLRLIGGRLSPAHTPAGVEVIGDVTLDELRAVFPGY